MMVLGMRVWYVNGLPCVGANDLRDVDQLKDIAWHWKMGLIVD